MSSRFNMFPQYIPKRKENSFNCDFWDSCLSLNHRVILDNPNVIGNFVIWFAEVKIPNIYSIPAIYFRFSLIYEEDAISLERFVHVNSMLVSPNQFTWCLHVVDFHICFRLFQNISATSQSPFSSLLGTRLSFNYFISSPGFSQKEWREGQSGYQMQYIRVLNLKYAADFKKTNYQWYILSLKTKWIIMFAVCYWLLTVWNHLGK